MVGNPLLDKAHVAGFRFWIKSSDFWNGLNTYDWATLDASLAAAAAKGKFLTVSIGFGVYYPSWMDDATYPKIAVGTDGLKMPLPFNDKYLSALDGFIHTMAVRYDSNPALRAVFITGHGPQLGENYVMKTPTDVAAFNTASVAAGFADKSAAYRFCVDHVFAKFRAEFIKTPLIFDTSNPWASVEHNGDQDYADSKALALGIGQSDCQLHAKVTHNGVAPAKRAYPHGEQAISNSSDHTRFYLAPIPDPWPSDPKPLLDLLESGYDNGDQYIEVYEPDLKNASNDSTCVTEGAKLISNIPK